MESALRPKDGWSASGQLIAGSSNSQVSMQVDFTHFGESGDYTVQFDISSSAPVVAEALVSWRVEGNEVTRRVSIGDGVSITGTCQGVHVRMYDNTPTTAFSTTPLNLTYGVSCQVTKGTRGSSTVPPTLALLNATTGYIFTVAPGATLNVPILQDAGATQVFITAFPVSLAIPPVNDAIVNLINASVVQKEWFALDYPTWVPLSPGADTVGLSVNAGAATSYKFSVTLGIDG